MSHDLALAQRHAWNLARTLMTTIILFRSDDEYGVLPADELDGAEVEALTSTTLIAERGRFTETDPTLRQDRCARKVASVFAA